MVIKKREKSIEVMTEKKGKQKQEETEVQIDEGRRLKRADYGIERSQR